jgi:MraZ protein
VTIRFRGKHDLRLDDKSRLSIPASFRQVLTVAGVKELVVVRGLNQKRLEAVPLPVWEEYEDRIARLPASHETRVKLLSFYEIQAMTEPDGHGRIVLPPDLRAHAGLAPNAEVRVTGSLDRILIWAADEWQTVQDETNDTKPSWTAQLADLGL